MSNETLSGTNSDNFTTASKVSVSNVPAGLTAVLTRTSATTLTLTGTAASHAAANNISNLTVTFANSAFTCSSAISMTNYTKNNLSVAFTNPVAANEPPSNPFNPAASTVVSLVPAGTNYAYGNSDTVTNLGNLGDKVGVSDNGVVVIQDVPKEPVKIKSGAPDQLLISVPESKNIPIQFGGIQVNVLANNEPIKGSNGKNTATLLFSKTLTNDQGQTVQALNVVSGQAQLTANQNKQIIGGLTLSKDSTQRDMVATAGTTGSTAGFYKDPTDLSGSVSAEKGDVEVVVKPSTSKGTIAGFAANTSTTTLSLKEGEVARFNSAGELTGVYIGSLSGTAGKTGDPLSVPIPANVYAYPNKSIAKIDGNSLGRLGNNLLPAFAEVVVGPATDATSYQASQDSAT